MTKRCVDHPRVYLSRVLALANPAGKEGVDTLEIQIVERVEFCRITLRRLDEHTLVRSLRARLPRRTSGGHHSSTNNNCRAGKRSRCGCGPRFHRKFCSESAAKVGHGSLRFACASTIWE